MFFTLVLFLIVVPYIFSGLVAWLAFVNIATSYTSFWWENIMILLTSWIVIFIWPAWLILEARIEREETTTPELV